MNGLLLTTALALPLGGGEACVEDLFLPIVECEKQSLEEWLRDFEGSGGRSSKALWCVYYRDDGSKRVRDVLLRWYRIGSDDKVRGEVFSILNHWGEEVEDPRPAAVGSPFRWNDSEYSLSTRPFSAPFSPLSGDLPKLRRTLAGDDRVARARAAVALVRRPNEVAPVIQTLVRELFAETKGTWRGRLLMRRGDVADTSEITGHALEWSIEFAGTAADSALLSMIGDPDTDDDLRRFVLRQVPFSRHQTASSLGPVLLPLVAREDEVGRRAADRIFQLAYPSGRSPIESWDRPDNDDLFFDKYRADIEDPDLAELVSSALSTRLEIELRLVTLTSGLLDEALWLAVRSTRVRTRVVAALRPHVSRGDALGAQILYVLASLGVRGEAVRDAYVRTLDSVEGWRDEDLLRVPCLAEHDGRTTGALLRLYRRVEDPGYLVFPIFAGGFFEDGGRGVGAEFLDWCDLDDGWVCGWVWSFLFDLGFYGEPEIRESDSRTARAMKLAIAIRTRQKLGRDTTESAGDLMAILRSGDEPQGNFGRADSFVQTFQALGELGVATPDFLDWTLEYLMGPDGIHHADAAWMLTKYPLSRKQQSVLCQVRTSVGVSTLDMRGLAEALAPQGENAVERVADLRERVWRGRHSRTRAQRIVLDRLDDVLRITRPTSRETEWLVLAIESGVCVDRRRALDLIATQDLVGPELRAAVERAANDVDDRVRFAARRLRDTW